MKASEVARVRRLTVSLFPGPTYKPPVLGEVMTLGGQKNPKRNGPWLVRSIGPRRYDEGFKCEVQNVYLERYSQ